MASNIHRLARRAAITGESLDELFRRECSHLFREVEGETVPAPEEKEIKGCAETDDK